MDADTAGHIRAKIAAGRLPLPSDPLGKMWVGKGTGRPCGACDRPITDAEIEYEIDPPTGQTIRFHKPCLDAWSRQRPAA
jgi:hypothetical protein